MSAGLGGCRIDTGEGTLQVNAGEYEVALPAVDRSTDETICGVHIGYLRDMTREFVRRGAKLLEASFGERGSPILFKDPAGPGQHVIMPMRIW